MTRDYSELSPSICSRLYIPYKPLSRLLEHDDIIKIFVKYHNPRIIESIDILIIAKHSNGRLFHHEVTLAKELLIEGVIFVDYLHSDIMEAGKVYAE